LKVNSDNSNQQTYQINYEASDQQSSR
jgi:hypothetical protein